MFNKIKAVKDLRSQAKTMQNALAEETVDVEHKGIKIKMDGNQQILSLDIPEDLLSPDKKSQLEGAIKDAVAESIKKVQRVMAKKMQEMGGLGNLGL